MQLDLDEVGTALYLTDANLKGAADLLKVTVHRLNRTIRKSRTLQLLIEQLREPS